MALVDIMLKAGYKIVVCHVEHGLRGKDGIADALFVEKYCRSNKIKYYIESVNVSALVKSEKLSVEEAARNLRYESLRNIKAKAKCDFIVTAHHKNDQAETFLISLLRGAGRDGLGGMLVVKEDIMRPFLDIDSEDLKEYCKAMKLNWCEDVTNTDLNYTRNKVRHLLIPLLEKEFNPNIVDTLVRESKILQQEEEFLNSFVEVELKKHLKKVGQRHKYALIDWYTLPKSLQMRSLKNQMHICDIDVSYKHLEAVYNLCVSRKSGKKIVLAKGWEALYAYDELVFRKAAKETKKPKTKKLLEVNYALKDLRVPIEIKTKKFALTLRAGKATTLKENEHLVCAIEYAKKYGNGFTIRTRRDGDVFVGASDSRKKLKAYFIDKKIPIAKREEFLLIAIAGNVLAIPELVNNKVEIENKIYIIIKIERFGRK